MSHLSLRSLCSLHSLSLRKRKGKTMKVQAFDRVSAGETGVSRPLIRVRSRKTDENAGWQGFLVTARLVNAYARRQADLPSLTPGQIRARTDRADAFGRRTDSGQETACEAAVKSSAYGDWTDWTANLRVYVTRVRAFTGEMDIGAVRLASCKP